MKQTQLTLWLKKLKQASVQYRYVLLILLIGLVLLLLPTKKQQTVEEPLQPQSSQDLQQELETLLRQVEGAGEVRVLLSWETDFSYDYQTDVERKLSDSDTEETRTTVMASTDNGEEPIPVRKYYPICKGAVVVCQGADSASVRLALVRAVASVTGLGSDRITVIKMKSGN